MKLWRKISSWFKPRPMAGQDPVLPDAEPLPGRSEEEKAEKVLLKRAFIGKFLGIPTSAFGDAKEETPVP